ncbi:MAG: hypothetical protein IJN91_04915 [Alphaproteobacteria bacterium]|nr:hypothetical protein [Alphaproteobacteria bacterium]
MKDYNKMINDGHIVQIKKDGIFVAGKPANVYHNMPIINPTTDLLRNDFSEIQTMQSNTQGCYAMTGNPTPAFRGTFLWIRAKSTTGIWSDWFFRCEYDKFECATKLAAMESVKTASILNSKQRPEFRTAVMKNIAKKAKIRDIISTLQKCKTK